MPSANARLFSRVPSYSGDFEMVLDGKRTRLYSAPTPEVPEGTVVKRVWLPYEQVNTYNYVDKKGHLHLSFASDAKSTRAHLEAADRLNVLGIGFWHLAAVTPEMWKVVREWHRRPSATGQTSRWLVYP